ncbi:hypothetical protein Nepgr_005945 [Nepenthes gracilis]|uniref:Stress-response A/B barrel domain-containing protein n=1 Tax=Nepenthes gracilis TaxID=150966 RepID=A0AAD3S4A3_NEPGR|nr:hypothetical protein Nepgr_005945 [Nepenthes gracilis]
MLYAGGRSLLHAPPTTLRSVTSRCFIRRPLSSQIRMSTQLVEHVVLFNVRDKTDPIKVNAMVNGLNGLKSLDMVLHLTAGPIHRHRSSSLKFTHMLHSRCRTKDDLSNYSGHQSHLGVVRETVLPICEDIMAVDWEAEDLVGPVVPPPGSAMRLQFVKLKDGLGEREKEEVVGVIGGLQEMIGVGSHISFGENFSPARAKGFSIASIGFFPGLSELDAAAEKAEIVKQKDRVRDYIDGLVVVDYVVPSSHSASL